MRSRYILMLLNIGIDQKNSSRKCDYVKCLKRFKTLEILYTIASMKRIKRKEHAVDETILRLKSVQSKGPFKQHNTTKKRK